MKISFLIPTKNGGEGFKDLIRSIKSNIDYALQHGRPFTYEIKLIINGDSQKPLSYIQSEKDLFSFVDITEAPCLGKIRSINFCLNNIDSEIVVILDDDISFPSNLLNIALKKIGSNSNFDLVAFQARALPYEGSNFFRRFLYDVINIRSLKKIYKEPDPFLFGRLVVIKKDALKVPDYIINEDLYLSIVHDRHYYISREEVFYIGESLVYQHIKRVLRIEAGRNQIKKIFGSIYTDIVKKNKRKINYSKLKSLNWYYKTCYYCYMVLRFFTNSVLAKVFKHKTLYW